MTREEAIENLRRLQNLLFNASYINTSTIITTCNVAIKALEQEPCEDAISRQAVIDSLHSKFADGFDSDRWWNSMSVLYAINKVPSVSTEKVGEWIPIDPEQHLFQCSVCGSESTVDTVMYKPTWKYCPNCKAKMEVEE